MKKWYKVRGVEYSTDYQFFLENQIFASRSNNNVTINSRIERYCFTDLGIMRSEDFDKLPEQIFKNIHNNILAGRHGEGVLID